MDVGGVVNDEYSVPHHGEVDGEVADVAALVVVLRHTENKRKTERQRVRKCRFIMDSMQIEKSVTFRLIYIVIRPGLFIGNRGPSMHPGMNPYLLETDTFHKYTRRNNRWVTVQRSWKNGDWKRKKISREERR